MKKVKHIYNLLVATIVHFVCVFFMVSTIGKAVPPFA
jgi:hypothetical protein